MSFWWQQPSSSLTLSFLDGSTTLANNYGNSAWTQPTVYLGSGTHTLKWVSSYTGGGGFGNNVAYLDEVSFTPGSTPPFISSEPRSQSQVTGMNARFNVVAQGTPPFQYQWRINAVDIASATNSSLTITNVQSTILGAYSVVVTNAVGWTNSSDAILEFGEVTAWGYDDSGQTAVAIGATNVLAISGGSYHCLGLRSDGAVFGWGTNNLGQLNIPADLTNVLAIATGYSHNLALKADGTVAAWSGVNFYGETNVPSGLTNVVAIAAGGGISMALRSDGSLSVWGSNFGGATNVPLSATNVVAISAGDTHCLALRADGSIVGWGDNSYGKATPPSNLTNAIGISGGIVHSVALTLSGTITGWTTFSPYGLKNVPPSATNVVAISAGYYHTVALRTDGTVVAWGQNSGGQTNIPSGLTNVVAIDTGGFFNVALIGSAPPVSVVSLSDPRLSADGFRVSLPTQSGRVFGLEYKESLADSNWTMLPLVAGTGHTEILFDSTATNRAQRFYRVRRW